MRRKKNYSSKKLFFVNNRGFSLIEILVVVTALILIAGFGFSTLVFTQRRQVVDQTAADIKLFIERAKYNASSRVVKKPVIQQPTSIPTPCDNKIPYAYEIDISSTNVVMNVLCKNTGDPTTYVGKYEEKRFPTQLTITKNGCLKFMFDVATNSISCSNAAENLPSIITISQTDGGYSKALNIDMSGNVNLQ